MLRVGLISDTHGLLRPEALAALAGADVILHAGDIGGHDGGGELLDALRAIAPVHAVRGNNDLGAWASNLPHTQRLRLEEVDVGLVHDFTHPVSGRPTVVVYGHSHRPEVVRRDGRLFVNPGSAGPRRFRLPVAVGWLHIDGDRVEAEIVELATPPPAR